MTGRARHRAPDGLLVEWQPRTPADLTELLAAVPNAYERLRAADAQHTALTAAPDAE